MPLALRQATCSFVTWNVVSVKWGFELGDVQGPFHLYYPILQAQMSYILGYVSVTIYLALVL